MRFEEEHPLFRKAIRERLEKADIEAMIAAHEKPGAPFAWEFIRAMADAGVCGVGIPVEYGGQGGDNLCGVIAMHEISRRWPGMALAVNVGAALVAKPLVKFGTEEQKRAWLPRLASGEIVGSFGLTEAEAGSDSARIKTMAEPTAGGWLINGEKHFITCAPEASFIILVALAPKGTTVFLMPCDRTHPGFSTGPAEEKIGQHAAHMGTVTFTNYPIPPDAIIGYEGRGIVVRAATLDHGREWIGAQGSGITERLLELTKSHAGIRTTFGAPLMARSSIRDIAVELAVALDAGRLLTWNSAMREDSGEPFGAHASLAKLFTSEEAKRLSGRAQEVYGGMGFLEKLEVGRLYKDTSVLTTYEGASNVQRSIFLVEWLKGRLDIKAPPLYARALDGLQKELLARPGALNPLAAQDQRFLFEVADTLPLMEAWRLTGEEVPPHLMAIEDQEVLQALLLERIKRSFPSKELRKKKALWDKAGELVCRD